MRATKRHAGLALLALSGILFSLAFMAAPAAAQPGDQGLQVLTIPPGQTGSIRLRGFCLDPGKPFPGGVSNPGDLAEQKVRAGLFYAASRGYADNNPRDVQDAVWFLQTGNWQDANPSQLAREIANAAGDTANNPPDQSGATSLLDAIKSNNVTAQISFTAAPDIAPNEAFYGDGELHITNNGNQEVRIYMPFGVVFPPQNPAEQRLVGYELAVMQAPTLTPAATSTAAPMNTAAPTSTAAPAPTETMAPAATATPAGQTLPRTGGEAGELSWGSLLLAVGMLTLGVGLILLRREEISV